MVINTNIEAQATTNNLNLSQSHLAKSLARLSSGSKIIVPSDDAAGLAVSSRLRSQIARLDSSLSNVINAVSFTQTQDGFMKTIDKAYRRMGELAILSQDTTKSDADRALYNQEFQQLKSYVQETTKQDFNGVSLFSGATLDVTVDAEGTTFSMVGINLSDPTYTSATNSGIDSWKLTKDAYMVSKDGYQATAIVYKTSVDLWRDNEGNWAATDNGGIKVNSGSYVSEDVSSVDTAAATIAKDNFVAGAALSGGYTANYTDNKLIKTAGHGMTTGEALTFHSTAPAGLSTAATYYVNAENTTTMTLHATKTEALTGANKVDLTRTGISEAKTSVTSATATAETKQVDSYGTFTGSGSGADEDNFVVTINGTAVSAVLAGADSKATADAIKTAIEANATVAALVDVTTTGAGATGKLVLTAKTAVSQVESYKTFVGSDTDLDNYVVTIDGNAINAVTAGADAEATVDALVAAINANTIAGQTVTAAKSGTGATAKLTLTANKAGTAFTSSIAANDGSGGSAATASVIEETVGGAGSVAVANVAGLTTITTGIAANEGGGGAAAAASVAKDAIGAGSIAGVTQIIGKFSTSTAHGLSMGDRVTITKNQPGGFTLGTTYYVKTVESTTEFTLSATRLGDAINPTSAVTNMEFTADTVAGTSNGAGTPSNSVTATGHGLVTGDKILLNNTHGDKAADTALYIYKTDANSFKLYDTAVNARAGGTTGAKNLNVSSAVRFSLSTSDTSIATYNKANELKKGMYLTSSPIATGEDTNAVLAKSGDIISIAKTIQDISAFATEQEADYDDVNLKSVLSSQIALGLVKLAITQVATDRARLGAVQSRLNFTNEQLTVTKENLSAAISRIADVDVAEEATSYARYQILVSSGVEMLKQANQLPQSALQLLR